MSNGKVLVLRYGTNIIADCMKLHSDVIKEKGYCWFGKIGRAPSEGVLNDLIDEGIGTVILYSRAGCYLCTINEIIHNKPKDSYPKYYDEYIFNQKISPSIYVKLTDMEEMDVSALSQYVVCSSGNPLPVTLNKSMNSFFVVQKLGNGESRKADKEKSTSVEKKKADTRQLEINDCFYRKNGKCNRRGFVSYQFDCERPSNCSGQRR